MAEAQPSLPARPGQRAYGSPTVPTTCTLPSPPTARSGRCHIDAAPDDVWAVISAPGYLEECHPFCAAHPVETWPGTGSRDRVVYHNGRVIERRFTTWLEGIGYDLEVSDGGGPAASVS